MLRDFKLKFLGSSITLKEMVLVTAMTVLLSFSAFYVFSSRYEFSVPRFKGSCIDIPWNFAIVDTWNRRVARDDLIVFKSRYMFTRKDGLNVAKYIRALPLDEASVKADGGVYVNQEKKAQGLVQSVLYKKEPEYFVRSEILDFDKYWGLGTAYNSVDSRYWGNLDESQIVGHFIRIL